MFSGSTVGLVVVEAKIGAGIGEENFVCALVLVGARVVVLETECASFST